jgi:F420-dependent oxidoreductase-like protein
MVTGEEMLQAEAVHALPLRERIGLTIDNANTLESIQAIIDAERAGVKQIWTTQGPGSGDALTYFAIAATQTSTIRLGTSILPTYPRHPLALAAQACTFHDIAPGRLRLGIGASHRPIIEGIYGIKMTAPLAHTHEYASILRAALWEGRVDHHGRFYNVTATQLKQARVPILISALGPGAFKADGEIADGAISWNCPVPYLLQTALPALQEGARQAQRPTPPLIAHISVAVSTDRQAVLAAARKRLRTYASLPFYRQMFAESGYPIAENDTLTDALIDNLVVSGDEQTITRRLHELLASGLDELLLMNIPVEDAKREWTDLARIIGKIQ